jgi:hypothetical protein
MKHLINLGTQFIGFRNEADDLRGKKAALVLLTYFSRVTHVFVF